MCFAFSNFWQNIIYLTVTLHLIYLSRCQNYVGECPVSDGLVHRVGWTWYAIIQNTTHRGGFVTHSEAKTLCRSYGLELAIIEDQTEMALVSKELAKLAQKLKLRDTWYWLNAEFDESRQKYVLHSTRTGYIDMPYSNFLYRPPRPIGIGKHISHNGKYQPNKSLKQCLTLALPWPWPEDRDAHQSHVFFGHQASFDERYCESKTKRHALCQTPHEYSSNSDNLYCQDINVMNTFEVNPNPETRKNYFYNGTWIFGDRKYIVNYFNRDKQDTEAYCQGMGLQMFSPGKSEKFLIPHLKMWYRAQTQMQFWTSLLYNQDTAQFLDKELNVVANHTLGINWNDTDTFVKRLAKLGRHFMSGELLCVAMSFSYELRDQMPCDNLENPNCSWSFIHYVPANCHNMHAAICQHKDHRNRTITWKKINRHDLTETLQEHAVTRDFGYKGNTKVLRSKVKQQYKVSYCPKGYRMMSVADADEYQVARVPPEITEYDIYVYDYQEKYYLFKHLDTTKPTYYLFFNDSGQFFEPVSRLSQNNWYHYLCIRQKGQFQKWNNTGIWPQPRMRWRDGPQPKFIPHEIPENFFNTSENSISSPNHSYWIEPNTRLRIITQVLKETPEVKMVLKHRDVDDILLHIHIFFSNNVTFNTFLNGSWGDEQTTNTFKFPKGRPFEFDIIFLKDRFQFYVDSQFFDRFDYRFEIGSIPITPTFYGGLSEPVAVFIPTIETYKL